MASYIELKELHLQRDGKAVLNGINMALEDAERLAVLGHNGAGKTTLLRAIVGLERIASGELSLFGQPCKTEPDFRAQRLRIGYLFQDSDDQLFCPSVIEDVAFGPCNSGKNDEQARAIAMHTLTDLGIDYLADRLTHKLSGGEKRLVCLAGLLAMQPDVLLLDEPTNGVDNEHGQQLRQVLLGFKGAILLVSHDEQFVVDIATRAMIMRNGKLTRAEIHEHQHVHYHPHIHAIAE